MRIVTLSFILSLYCWATINQEVYAKPTKKLPTPTSAAITWQPGWQCGRVIAPSKQLITQLLKNHALHGYSLNGKALPVLVGQSPEQLGAILFVKHKSSWRSYPIAQGGLVLAAYSTAAYNRIVLFATWGKQGLGNDYLAIRGKDQFGSFSCTPVHLPAELDRPDWGNQYPGLHDFNILPAGTGTLISAAYLQEGRKTVKHWYHYQTKDWGKSWSEAKRVAAPTQKVLGVFKPLQETPAAANLVKDLLSNAR